MLTTKNWRAAAWRLALSTTAAAALAACSPSGPRLLLQGEQLIQQGKPAEAIPKLREAVSLLPENAQAWNHLGLAYHGAGDSNEAVKAYQQALERDPTLHSARYNLGCLYLEHGQLQPALTHLSSFTAAVPDSIDGWMKLATAQARGRQLDIAERSYQRVLRLSPRHAEALNSLGLLQLERKRLPDAFNYFSMAAQQQPPHAPAILNLAILHHQHLGNPLAALQAYTRYLELQPGAGDDVRNVLRTLQADLAAGPAAPVQQPPASEPPAPLAQIPPPALAAVTPSQNSPGPASNPPSVAPPAPSANPATPPATTTPARTTAPEIAQPATRPASVQPPREPAPRRTEPSPTLPAAVQEPLIASAEPKAALPAVQPFGQRPNDSASPGRFETREPMDASPPPLASAPAGSPSADRPARLPSREAFRSRVTPLEPTETRVALLPPTSSTVTAPARAAAPVSRLRYVYRNPARPEPGDRLQARHALLQGIQTHQQRHFSAAIEFYRDAIELDPSLFEAHYNLGLAWFEMRDPARALSAYEDALSINPTSFEARYNFALALERSRYYQDAARELEQVLSDHPGEVKAHLTLARLYAQQFEAPDLARPHYRKVLELDPRHPNASEIRYWLGTAQ